MNAVVESFEPEQPRRTNVATTTPADLVRLAVEQNADLERLSKLMDLQERWEAQQARKAFVAAMAAFREQHVTVLRSREVQAGPLKGTTYAVLSDFVNAAAPALSKNGLSATWRITRDEKEWIEIACIVRHVDGHQESITMGGPPDVGGAKNAVQARASTVSYLEKYTLKMALGLAEQNDDNDGQGGAPEPQKEPQQQREAPPPKPKPEYPDEQFQENLSAWVGLIATGKKTHDRVIGMLETKFTLSDEQKATIRKIEVAP